jgi:hypothetical protein
LQNTVNLSPWSEVADQVADNAGDTASNVAENRAEGVGSVANEAADGTAKSSWWRWAVSNGRSVVSTWWWCVSSGCFSKSICGKELSDMILTVVLRSSGGNSGQGEDGELHFDGWLGW